jgi:hypothetical protein
MEADDSPGHSMKTRYLINEKKPFISMSVIYHRVLPGGCLLVLVEAVE